MTAALVAALVGAVVALVLARRLQGETAGHRATKDLLAAALKERESAKEQVRALEGAVASRDRLFNEAMEVCRADSSPDATLARLRWVFGAGSVAPPNGTAAPGQLPLFPGG